MSLFPTILPHIPDLSHALDAAEITHESIRVMNQAVRRCYKKKRREQREFSLAKKVAFVALDIIRTAGAIIAAITFLAAALTFSLTLLSVSIASFALAVLADRLNPKTAHTLLIASWSKVYDSINEKNNGDLIVQSITDFEANKARQIKSYAEIAIELPREFNAEKALNNAHVMGYFLISANKIYAKDYIHAKEYARLAVNKLEQSDLSQLPELTHLAHLIENRPEKLYESFHKYSMGRDPASYQTNTINHVASIIKNCQKGKLFEGEA